MNIAVFIISLFGIVGFFFFLHWISYKYFKNRVVMSRSWDLNVCSGKTDGGGVNVDIYKHTDVPNLVIVNDVYNLPFKNNEFKSVLSSHTIEHVDDPKRFYDELSRVGEEVTLLVPPLWDVGAALNIFEHKWIFLTWRMKHAGLPAYVRLPGADVLQKKFGQINHA